MAPQTPDFLVVGHVTKDVLPSGYALGGTATYASLLAARLGLSVGVVTSASPDVPLRELMPWAQLAVAPSDETTTFENIYTGNHRTQRVLACARPLSAADVPPEWARSPVTLLGPIAAELSDDLFDAFPHSFLALTPQGMMREWGGNGTVRAVRWKDADRLLPAVSVAVLSEDDLPDQAELDRYLSLARILVVTHNVAGATVYADGSVRTFPAYACDVADPTGAGDVFAAAFTIAFAETGDAAYAGAFANCAASFVIGAPGTAGVPFREQIEQRLAGGQVLAADSVRSFAE